MDEVESNMVINMLLQAHKSATLNKPICTNHVDFSIGNSERLRELLKNQYFVDEILSRSVQKFNLEGYPRGSVHLDPTFFMQVCLEHLANGVTDIPNGSSNSPDCPIYRFYQIVTECANSMLN